MNTALPSYICLFRLPARYKAQSVDLETRLKPFIPDYIPAVGGLDEFIKTPRPDGKPDFLGLKVSVQGPVNIYLEGKKINLI